MASSPDSSPRSKTRRTASSGENLESAASGQGSNEGKRGFYHCNYCNKDISGKIRIKCAQCPDFDLCVECFSVGAEVTPHKSNHPYRVMDNLSFSLICPDWTADEEILLLEGIEMFGLGDWAEIAEHVGTKTKAQCIDHYTTAYLNSPCFPLPDMSYAAGKNREELLAMSKEHAEGKIDVDSGVGSGNTNLMAACSVKKASNMAQVKDGPDSIKVEAYYLNPKYQYSRNLGLDDDLIRAVHTVVEKLELDADIQSRCIDEMKSFRDGNGSFGRLSATRGRDGANPDSQVDRSVGGKKPSMTELSGYNPKRQEFDPEYDNDAEKLLAEMEFKDTDTEAERELKLRVLRIYSKRLDKRKRRKDFILERNLLNPNPLEMELSPEEREIYQRYMVFMRFLSKDKYEELIWTVIEEHRIRKRLQDLEEAKAAGCHTSAEADRFNEQKRKEAEENARRVKESTQAGPNGSPRVGVKGCMGLDSSSEDPPSSTLKQATSCSMDDWDITGYPGSDLLSVTEKRLCQEMKLLPRHYLNMQLKMSVDILNGNITRKSDAYRFFEVEPSKVDRVYDMLVKKGIAQP